MRQIEKKTKLKRKRGCKNSLASMNENNLEPDKSGPSQGECFEKLLERTETFEVHGWETKGAKRCQIDVSS